MATNPLIPEGFDYGKHQKPADYVPRLGAPCPVCGEPHKRLASSR